jgi:PAS domain-containing protein
MRDEATIEAHPALLRAWLDATPDGVIAVDASGRVLIHNGPASGVTKPDRRLYEQLPHPRGSEPGFRPSLSSRPRETRPTRPPWAFWSGPRP